MSGRTFPSLKKSAASDSLKTLKTPVAQTSTQHITQSMSMPEPKASAVASSDQPINIPDETKTHIISSLKALPRNTRETNKKLAPYGYIIHDIQGSLICHHKKIDIFTLEFIHQLEAATEGQGYFLVDPIKRPLVLRGIKQARFMALKEKVRENDQAAIDKIQSLGFINHTFNNGISIWHIKELDLNNTETLQSLFDSMKADTYETIEWFLVDITKTLEAAAQLQELQLKLVLERQKERREQFQFRLLLEQQRKPLEKDSSTSAKTSKILHPSETQRQLEHQLEKKIQESKLGTRRFS